MADGRYEDERWANLPLDLDLDFDAVEPARLPVGVPEHYRLYLAWWGRPWPVQRDSDRDPDIPTLPDISTWKA